VTFVLFANQNICASCENVQIQYYEENSKIMTLTIFVALVSFVVSA